MKAFISYSHRDEAALNRLHTHLAMLRRDGLITEWYDREILAGGIIDDEISQQLETSDTFLALVSPDFLHSNYCYEQEMGRAMERHEAGEIKLVPIIVEHCDWLNSPLRRFRAVPRDGNPISAWANENEAYLDVVNELRRLIQRNTQNQQNAPMVAQPPAQPVPPRYRVRRDFNEIERSDFRTAAFREIREFFESSIQELNQVDGLSARFRPMDETAFTCTVINRMREHQGQPHITIRTSAGGYGMGDIYYSFNENAPENTANGWFNVEADDYDMFLTQNNFMSGNERERLSARQSAESLWGLFVRNAGVDYE